MSCASTFISWRQSNWTSIYEHPVTDRFILNTISNVSVQLHQRGYFECIWLLPWQCILSVSAWVLCMFIVVILSGLFAVLIHVLSQQKNPDKMKVIVIQWTHKETERIHFAWINMIHWQLPLTYTRPIHRVVHIQWNSLIENSYIMKYIWIVFAM
jgi:hypothetical protein